MEAILDGTKGPEMNAAVLLEPFPLAWKEQIASFQVSA